MQFNDYSDYEKTHRPHLLLQAVVTVLLVGLALGLSIDFFGPSEFDAERGFAIENAALKR